MRESLSVEVRETSGKRNNRRLRATGRVPAVLYGHGLANLNLTVASRDVESAVRHHSRLVDLKGAANESALISDEQWDTFGIEMLHVDFTRVSADERIEVEVAVELKGQAPGAKEGGVVEQLIREVRIECPAGAIPEKLVVNINQLKIGDSLTCAAIELSEGATLLSDADGMVVHCVTPKEEEEGGVPTTEGAEPELIGRKPSDEEEAEE
jgi:large subunit ribosomal protein L25